MKRKTCRKWANYDSQNIWTPGVGLSPPRGNIHVYYHNIQRFSSLKNLNNQSQTLCGALIGNGNEKVQVGKDQEKAQSEKDSHSKNRGGKKPNQQSGTYTMKHIVSRMSSYFPNRWPLSYLNLTKIMKTHIRRQQHKKVFKHQDIKQKEPPQKYRLGTISNTKLLAGLNRFYMAITSPSASAVVHNI